MPPRFLVPILSIPILVFWAASAGVSAPVPKVQELTIPFVKWSTRDEIAGNGLSNALVVRDRVIVGTDKGELRAYRSSDGEPLWTHAGNGRIHHRPCSDGILVFYSSSAGLAAVSADKGAREWTVGDHSYDGPTLVLAAKGLVYVGGEDGKLHALDIKTGDLKWSSDFVADAPPDPPGFAGDKARMDKTLARPTALASDGETLFLSVFDQSRVVAFDAAIGKRRWSFQAKGWVYGSAVPTATHVYFGSQDKNFYCLDKASGKEVWQFKTKSRIESGGAVDDESVYFGSCDGNLYCLRLANGTKRWEFAADLEQPGRKSAIYSVPVLSGGNVLFAAGEGQLYAVTRKDGNLKWKLRPSEKSEMYCSAATDGERYFVTTRPRLRSEGENAVVAVGLK